VSQSDFVSRGQALVAAGQFQEAVKVCRLGLLGRPTTVEGRVVLGQALLALKRYDEVLAEMRVALELDHSSIGAQILKAEALLRKGDFAPAIETLHKARQAAPGDARILQLLGEAENGPLARPSVTHPAVGFIGSGDTKHYPGHPTGGEPASRGSFTEPTSLQSPGGARRSSQKRAVDPEPTPPAGADRTGTVEVDPELEGVEVEDDIDFDDLAAPPSPVREPAISGARGSVKSPRSAPDRAAGGNKSAVRSAVAMPSGVLGEMGVPARPQGKSVPPPRSKAPSAQPMQPMPLGAPFPRGPVVEPPAAPLPPAPRSPVAAVLPTMTAAPPTSVAAANRPTLASSPPAPLHQEPLFRDPNVAPAWGTAAPDPHSIAAANVPTARPAELDPHILALMSGQPTPTPPAVALDQQRSKSPSKGAMKTGRRKTRSRLSVVMWFVVGTIVIGGGVFAGFQIRAMRLEKQIVAARQRATDLASADTWKGWRDARDSLAGIVHASPTLANRAALARTRAKIAFEFGDGIADAKSDVESLAGEGGFDGRLAAAYLALAQGDARAAKAAADAALGDDGDDPAAHYIAGHAALLAGDAQSAVTHIKIAAEKEARPLHGVGLARAHAAASHWDDAIAALDGVLQATPDHPAAAIARGAVLVAAGRVFAASSLGGEVKAQLERVVGQGKRPLAEQQHGVSPAQVAFGHVVLARVNFVRNDPAANNDLRLALAVNLDDQRFAEEVTDTLYLLGEHALARSAADKVLQQWPASHRARIALARTVLAQGRTADAIELLSKQPDVIARPDALALRGHAHLSAGDPASAAADFDAALKKVPHYEPALIGRAWVELATGEVDAATKRVAERYDAKSSTVALATVHAATLRHSADPLARETAKAELEKLVGRATGTDLARAQLELARVHRDLGDFRSARPAYSAAVMTGLAEARLEYGLLLIEDRDPTGGREMLDKLLVDAGEQPSVQLVLEAARARMLVGDHAGAQALLDRADKMPGAEAWKLDRERGRLALRKSQFPAAATALARALDKAGGDAETFLLAADVGVYEKALADKVRKLAPERLKGRPEAKIIEGKLLIVAEKYAEAEEAYRAAKAALRNEKASPRRLAQADFGLGLVAYIRESTVEALQTFELVMDQDPSLIDTYAFASEITKDARRALQFAQKAVQYNPDYPYAWLLVGRAAHRVRDRRTLTDAINRLSQIAPTGDELKELRALR
jgi:tetratricopeptide (TPR) repeat protein